MANEKHLNILTSGVLAWNEWRRDNSDLRPDLTRSDLRGMDFSNADLSKTDFTWSMMTGSSFVRANLFQADLHWALLDEASFRGANLRGANLYGSRCRGVDFRSAFLIETNMNGAYCWEANLTGAILGETVLGNVALVGARGLKSCKHVGPSLIDFRTLDRSGSLPAEFLRGCGLPDSVIDNLPVLLRQPINFYSCFISYSISDQEFANRLYVDLQKRGVRCWFAPHDMLGGKKVEEQIDLAIGRSDRLLLILSDHSMNSRWVATEIANARKREITEGRRILFPISLVGFEEIRNWSYFDADVGQDLAKEIRSYFVPSFQNWKNASAYRKGLSDLMRSLRIQLE